MHEEFSTHHEILLRLHFALRYVATSGVNLISAAKSTYEELRELGRALRRMVVVAVEIILGIAGVGVEMAEETIEREFVEEQFSAYPTTRSTG